MSAFHKQLLAILMLLSAQSVAAKPRKVFFGNCAFVNDPQKTSNAVWPAACFRAKASGYGIKKSETLPLWQKYYSTEGYLGLHLNNMFSVHGSAHQNVIDQEERIVQKTTDNMFLQIGNPALHRLRITAGYFTNSFGINDRPLPEAYYSLYKNNEFWDTEKYSARITIDDLATTQFDLGASTDRNIFGPSDTPTKGTKKDFDFTGRLIHDISALGGTRFMASYLERPNTQRRLSLGMLTISPQNATASFEWVRVWHLDTKEPFSQILRFVYYDGMQLKNRMLFEYENELRQHWMTTVGYDYNLFKYGYWRNSVSYYRSAIDKDLHHWVGMTGIGLYLL
jgi:hypothetical protein